MPEPLLPISAAEDNRLAELEIVIQSGLQTFTKVADALLEIRDSRLYRQEFATFQDYCEQRFGISRPRAYQLMAAGRVAETLSTSVDVQPISESQVRPLAGLDPELQRQVWEAAVASTPEGETPTGRRVEEAKEQILGSRPSDDIGKAPRLTRKQRITGAWNDVDQIFGNKFTKWVRAGRMTDDEALEFYALTSDADKKQVRSAMVQGASFRDAVNTLTGLQPTDPITTLHTRAVQEKCFVAQIGEFVHAVAFDEKAKAELLEWLKDWPK